jgi:phosphopantothenoylcysteine decarboxylase
MPSLDGQTIILGVTGSIAAYKAADIASELTKLGAGVFVVMTKEATQIIAPLTLQVLSRHPVGVDLWEEGKGWQPGHIELADQADLLLVAPATANILACFAHGLAPDLLTAIYLATPAPVMIAPAMNGKMLAHPATRANLATLRARGHHFVDPTAGVLACGYEGEGKLAPVADIVCRVEQLLAGKKKKK